MSTPIIAIIIAVVVAILFSCIFIATAKDKGKAFTKLLIVLFLIAGVISLLGYAILYTPAGEIIAKFLKK